MSLVSEHITPMRWLFQRFEGIDLLHARLPDGSLETQILRLLEVPRLVLHLLGPANEHAYLTAF